MLREGYRLPFLSVPSLSSEPIPMPSYSPNSIKGKALEEVTLSLVEKGSVELAPLPSPGYYSWLFLVWKTSGSWQPVIVLSMLNRSVSKTPFKMETLASVLLSVRKATGWSLSTSRRRTCRFPSVRTAASSCGLWLSTGCISFLHSAAASRPHHRYSPGL